MESKTTGKMLVPRMQTKGKQNMKTKAAKGSGARDWRVETREAMAKLDGLSRRAARLFFRCHLNPKKRGVLDVVFNAEGREVVECDRGVLAVVDELVGAGLAKETARRHRRPYGAAGVGWTAVRVYVRVPELS